MRQRDIYSSLVFFSFGILFIVSSLNYLIWDKYGPGPGFLPFVLGIILCFLGLILFLSKLTGDKGKETSVLLESYSFRFSIIKKVIIFLCFIFMFYFVFNWLGCFLGIFGFMLSVLRFLGKKSLRLSIYVSFTTSLLSYLLFVKLLGVPLPLGILLDPFAKYLY